MRNPKHYGPILAAILLLTGVSCTVHPPGERDERDAAETAGKPFQNPPESRQLPPLPDDPSTDQIVQYAMSNNAEIEQRYWEWRSALDQIPQDGSQTGSLNVAGGTTITRGHASLSTSTIALSNDPMTDIKWPDKLDAAARAALENARAAGHRFRKAQYDLRAKVLDALYDYALNAQLIRLAQSDRQLLQTISSAIQSKNSVGSARQQDILKAANDLDMSINDITTMQSQLPSQRASINAILNRPLDAPLAPPTQLPPVAHIQYSDSQIVAMAAHSNPELQALADQIEADHQDIRLAKLQYIPDFNLSVGTDLMGLSQSILGQATIPVFRHEAIEAAIAQACDNLKAIDAMRRQTSNDLNAQILSDITTLRDAQCQLDLISTSILPRLQQMLKITQTAYESGQASLSDLMDDHRLLIDIERLIANLRIAQVKHLADLEAITCNDLTTEPDQAAMIH